MRHGEILPAVARCKPEHLAGFMAGPATPSQAMIEETLRMSGDDERHDGDHMASVVPELRARIAELEAALDELRGHAYPMSRGANGGVTTMCVPIGAWENAMRFIEPSK